MRKKILIEIYKIDMCYLSKINESNFDYLKKFIEIDSENAENIVMNFYINSQKFINSHKKKPKKFIFLISYLKNLLSQLCIDYSKNIYIKNNDDFILALLCFFTYKSISSHNPIEIKIKNHENNNETTNFNFNESDYIINCIILYIEKISIWIKIITSTDFQTLNNKDTRLVLIWFLTELSANNDCYLKYIKSKYPNNRIFFKITHEYEISFNVEISNISYKTIFLFNKIIYIYSYHYTTVWKILKKNPLSGEVLGSSDSFFTALNNILNNYIYICNDKLNVIIDDLCEHHFIERKNLINEYKNVIKMMQEHVLKKDNEMIKILSKQVSIYLKIINLIILFDNNNNKKIYLPVMFCFRGRTYYLSNHSMTFQKEIRYCSNWGDYELSDFIDNSEKNPLENKINAEIEKWHYLIEKIDIKLENNKLKNGIIWLLISLGEINKNKKTIWKINEFIEEGINIYKNDFKDISDIDTKLKIKHIISIIKEIKNNNKIKKWLLSKDATASVFQHSAKAVGIKDKEMLKWFNFKSDDTWYDTYSYIINLWKEKINIDGDIDFLNKYFKRSTLKNTIMTHTYGAKYLFSFKKFIKLVTNDVEKFISKEENKKLENFYKSFFLFLESEIHLLACSGNDMRKNLLKIDKNIIFSDNVSVNLKYKKYKKKQIEMKINNKRIVRQELYLLEEDDNKKLVNAIRANYVQALDASLVRWYFTNNYKGVTIHDCFMVDFLSTSLLIARINQGMRIKFHTLNKNLNFNIDEIFSIFILL